MGEKIVNLMASGKINPKALMAQMLEREDIDAVVCVVRINGSWETAFGGDVNLGGLSMAAIKLLHDVGVEIHEEKPNGR